MKLLGSLTSPYVRKVRVLLREKNIPHEFVVADSWAPDSEIPGLNPLGKVPVLVLDDGDVLFDSPVICEYVDGLKAPALIPPKGEARLAVLRWHALAHGILDATSTRVLEYRRPVAQQSADNIVRQEGKIARALEFAERTHPGGPYLVQEQFTFADLALGVALDYVDLRYAHSWRVRHSRLAAWLAALITRPAFAGTEPPGLQRPATAH